MTAPQLVPDTPEHHTAHDAAQRALAAGYRPVICADETGQIVVLVAFLPHELDELLADANRPLLPKSRP
jgi:hypothetical protein